MTQEGNVATLKICGCSLLDAGEYTCALNNDAGGTFCTVNVNVEGKLRCSSMDSVYRWILSTNSHAYGRELPDPICVFMNFVLLFPFLKDNLQI